MDDGMWFLAYQDDASRKIVGFGVFKEATGKHAIEVLKEAISSHGKPASVLTDRGSQFYASPKEDAAQGESQFQKELRALDIRHILAGVNHPQTNGNLERFFHTLETEMVHFRSVADFIGYYNERRLHFSLDIDNGETPLMAFRNKKADKVDRASKPTWMEADA